MLNFENYEYIADYMKDYIDDVHDSISVVTNKDMAVEIMYELLRWEDVNLSKCNIEHDSYYDKEYMITLYYDPDDNNIIWVDVEEAYSNDLNRYIVGSDSVLFYEDVNSKALIDMENNPFFENVLHDWFTIGEKRSDENDNGNSNNENNDSGYSVRVKVDLDTPGVQSETKRFINMEIKKSLLNLSSINIPNTKLSIRIPTVGEILEDEFTYYSIVSSLTASPFQYMVQLDDMGIDFTKVTDYELFKMLFLVYTKSNLSILFGDLNVSDFGIYRRENQEEFIYNNKNHIEINEKIYNDLVDIIRRINLFEKINYKPGNESARKYLLEKERKKQKRNANKPHEPYLEKLVIALVNTGEFPYDYDSCMDLSIYRFNQSFKQIQHKIAFDKTMIGVYAGTVDTSKLSNKDNLTWIPNK